MRGGLRLFALTVVGAVTGVLQAASLPDKGNLTTAHKGKSLESGVYTVEGNLTLNGDSAQSALTITDNRSVVLYLKPGSQLNVLGGAASGQSGAGAGIRVDSGSTLVLTGAGTVTATGGGAAGGGTGGNGGDGWFDGDYGTIGFGS